MSQQNSASRGPLPRLRGWRVWILALATVCGAMGIGAPDARAEAVLSAVDVGTLPGNSLQLRFHLSEDGVNPTHFSVNEPARIVLDLPGTRNGMGMRRQDIGGGIAERISVIEASDRTRILVNLSHSVPYTVRTEGKTVLLTLNPSGTGSQSAIAQANGNIPPEPTHPRARAAAGTRRELSKVDFRRGPEGQARIVVSLSDPTTSVDVHEEGKRIVADFVGATLPPAQQRRLDVTDFGTPVSMIEASNKGRNGHLAIDTEGDYELIAFQSDGEYTIEVRPVASGGNRGTTAGGPQERAYKGELLSLNFQDIEVRAVLQIIADFTGLNVVVSDTVTGRITLRLRNVPWDQALDIILQTKGLTQRQQGTVIYIAPTAEVTQREKLEIESRKQAVELATLHTEIIQINYAKAGEIAKLIKGKGTGTDNSGRSSVTATSEISILSDRGQLAVDERTNSLVIMDLPERIADARALITKIDIPVRQVMIDSRIVIANDDFSREIGAQFGGIGLVGGPNTGVVIGGNTTGINNALANGETTLSDRLGFTTSGAQALSGNSSIALSLLSSKFQLDLELSALQAEGRGEILSNPRVLTADRKEASIKQGREIPYSTSSSNNGTNVQFKDALLELTVTPQITPDKNIIMDLKVTKNETTGEVVENQPVLAKRELSTQVLVRNGETVVLGGVFEQITSNNVSKIPLLGDIPFVGAFFRYKSNSNKKLELLIFVTPQIVDGNVVIR
ncbi:type IV pilus secretin PilQ [Plasticicumulans acidivorans]|uniref:Type IV pilus assembly protein PilQ n=1 Tax=Plasticicumulans acidivorans TaxID=886464 RepID=A0A317MQ69_9GAMM|nr:type IV pilus secretin PilQ [Plasticicumulans acidivorans]PWV58698.1 type IV pilus assembly protein PilQ [Plasticicumulans acidivorans]